MFYSQPAPSRLLVIFLTLAGLLNWTVLPAPANTPAQIVANAARAPEAALKPVAGGAAQARARAAYGQLPMRFERNQGQFDERVKFAARGAGYALWLTGDEALLSLQGGGSNTSAADVARREFDQEPRRKPTSETKAAVIGMKLVNANRGARTRSEGEMPGHSNYFVGNDPAKWQTGVSHYAGVRYTGVYRGVDLVYYGNGRELEYDFKVAAGGDAAAIGWRIEGAKRLRVDASGELVISTAAGEVRQHQPIAYQGEAGKRRSVAARYMLRGKNQVGFALSRYDRRKPLVIDPVLVYSTFLGGSDDDAASAIAVDSAGNAYVTGYTYATDFPTTAAFQPTSPGIGDTFVSKINASGTALIYSTYLGGNTDDLGYGIAVDGDGNAYVTGTTWSDDFPTVNPIQANHR
jgi:hypothetical protein